MKSDELPTVRPRRSFIFSPGLKPEMFPKALACGADIVCVELEVVAAISTVVAVVSGVVGNGAVSGTTTGSPLAKKAVDPSATPAARTASTRRALTDCTPESRSTPVARGQR